MNTEITDISATQKKMQIEIAPETIREAYNKVSQKYAKGANVPGFRKGFAPLDVVRVRFKDEIRQDVMQEILPKAITDAFRENDQMPLTEPEVHLDDPDNTKFNGSQPISIHVHYEVMPQITDPEYKNLELTRRVRPVNDGEIEDYIEQRREEYAALIPIEDRKSEEGDTVIVDLEGAFVDEPEAEPIKADDLEIPLGDETIEKSFSENLIGVEEDEVKEFTVSYPEEFSSPALAGKTINYKAKIKSVGRIEKPALDDEWAKSLDEGYESLADLRKNLREDLEKYSESDADARLRLAAVNKIIEQNEFEVPNALVENQSRNLLQNFAQDLAQRGVDLSKVGQDFVESAYGQMRQQAERDVRGAMLLEKIAEIENVEVTDAEFDEELEKMSSYYGVSAEEIRSSLKENNGEMNIRHNLRTNKAIDAIIENAEIKQGEWVEPKSPEFEMAADDAVADSEETEITEPETENAESKTKSKKSSE